LLKPFSIVFFLSIFFPVVSQNANQAGFYFKNDSFRPVKDTYVICSWNLKDFGKSKSTETLDFIATTVSNSDVVAIQEVVAGNGGVETVSKLAQILNNGTLCFSLENGARAIDRETLAGKKIQPCD